MAKMGKSMSVASRLAAATALTGTLAACDGRFGRASDELFAPISSQTPTKAALDSPAPAAPGNPVYIGGSQSANDAQYRDAYGAPVAGSGQAIPAQPTYAGSVYQDDTISAAPITDIPGGPVIDAGVPAPVTTTETVIYSEPVSIQPQYSAPATEYIAPEYSAPASGPTSPSFPPIGGEPVYLPQSSLPQQGLFTDASAINGAQTAPPVSSPMPRQSVPYGSSASHRYLVTDRTIPSVDALPVYAPDEAAMPLMVDEGNYAIGGFETAAPVETVEVASLSTDFMPIPRIRPEHIGPVFKSKNVTEGAPVPKKRPVKLLSSPVPTLRPIQLAALSGRAITDAPALTEPPQMIEVEPIFLDEPPAVTEVEPQHRRPPEAPVPDASELKVTKPENLETEIAALDTSKVTIDVGNDIAVSSDDAPRVEIAPDVGDLKELSGTSWRLASLDGEEVPATAELHFDGDSGFAGGQGLCNNYGGEFKESLKGEFQMENIFSTEVECDHFALEKKYIVALETAAEYRTTPGLGELKLIGPDGKTIATFAAF